MRLAGARPSTACMKRLLDRDAVAARADRAADRRTTRSRWRGLKRDRHPGSRMQEQATAAFVGAATRSDIRLARRTLQATRRLRARSTPALVRARDLRMPRSRCSGRCRGSSDRRIFGCLIADGRRASRAPSARRRRRSMTTSTRRLDCASARPETLAVGVQLERRSKDRRLLDADGGSEPSAISTSPSPVITATRRSGRASARPRPTDGVQPSPLQM